MGDPEIPEDSEAITRRGFAAGVLAAATLTLLPVASVGESEAGKGLGVRPEGLSVPDWDEVNARYSNLLRVYGERLSSEQKRRVMRILTANQHMLVSVRSFLVRNSDPSACTLRIYDPAQYAGSTE